MDGLTLVLLVVEKSEGAAALNSGVSPAVLVEAGTHALKQKREAKVARGRTVRRQSSYLHGLTDIGRFSFKCS
eukprot:3293883-Amphidinium_carterae.1